VQEGLASRLDIQAIYDLVGDKIREVFDAQAVLIAAYDHAAETTSYNYNIEKGVRYYPEPRPFAGLARYLIRTRQTVLINENADQRSAELGMVVIPGTENPKSMLFTPLIVGDVVRGMISLQNVDREHAFSDSDVRLLQTLANSMSVALENARLFDETQRLLKETEQRNIELAIINSVQEGLASKLDMQAIYDLVGDKIRDLFDAQVVVILTYDRQTDLAHPAILGVFRPFDQPHAGQPVDDLAGGRRRQPQLITDPGDLARTPIVQPHQRVQLAERQSGVLHGHDEFVDRPPHEDRGPRAQGAFELAAGGHAGSFSRSGEGRAGTAAQRPSRESS